MPRKSRAKSEDDTEVEFEDDENVNDRNGRRSANHRTKQRAHIRDSSDDDADDGAGTDAEGHDAASSSSPSSHAATMMFSSQAPEATQEMLLVKDHERVRLLELSEHQRERAVHDLSRLVLFKALAGEAIDRTKCLRDAGVSDAKISSAAFDEVNLRLYNCFGFTVRRLPEWMERIKGVSKAQKERYYVTNGLHEADGSHSKALHMVHPPASVEKGLLMVVLGFIYCKGHARHDGSRWIHDRDLYALLHRLDDSLPSEPPAANSKRAKSATQNSARGSSGSHSANASPDVDALLHKFVSRDYLLKEKASEQLQQQSASADEHALFYAMGPRAAIEIGRRQVIFFCAEILDAAPDATMLQELEAGNSSGGTAMEEDGGGRE